MSSLSKNELATLISRAIDEGAIKVASVYDYATLRDDGSVKYTWGDYESSELAKKPKDAWPLVALDPEILRSITESIE